MRSKISGVLPQLTPHLIVALDQLSEDEAYIVADDLQRAGVKWLKVGLELYTKSGPRIVSDFRSRGLNVFLDLKLHDIPNTVARAVAAAGESGAELLTIHCSGGSAMLRAARRAAEGTSIKLIGVTVLTSLGEEDVAELRAAWGAPDEKSTRQAIADRLASLAAGAGLHGIVCSVPDLAAGTFMRLAWERKPLFVTPGIRAETEEAFDQKSTATIERAVRAGASHLVIGRPILRPTAGSVADAAARALEKIKEAGGVI